MRANRRYDLCGWGFIHPRWLQRFHTPLFLTLCIALTSLVQGMLMGGFSQAANTILEKRFYLSNKEISAIDNVNQVVGIVALLLVSHFGNYGHKGRWLALGSIFYAIGSLVFTIPQFAVGPYSYAGQGGEVTYCRRREPNPSGQFNCSQLNDQPPSRDSGIHNFLYLFMFAKVLMGLGAAPGPVLAPTYIDENVSHIKSPKLLGLLMTMQGFGPLVGSGLNSVFVNIWGDIGKVDISKIDIKPSDERWYGAWWIGFLLSGVLGIFFAIPLLGFARKLPGSEEDRAGDMDQAFNQEKAQVDDRNWRNLPRAVLALFTNPIFDLIVLSHILMGFLMSGMGVFMVKLLELMFRLSTSTASLVMAFCAILPVSLGSAFGGFIVSRLKLKVFGLLLFAAITSAIAMSLMPSWFLHCQAASIAGINENYPGASEMQLGDSCHEGCGCARYGYQPVCDQATGVSFYSPCFAGCTETKNTTTDDKAWQNCGCLASRNVSSSVLDVAEGLCTKYCYTFPIFAVIFGFLGLLGGSGMVSMQQVFLRSVGFNQRTLALALSWLLTRLLGMMPGGMAFGALYDNACEFSESEVPKPKLPPGCPEPPKPPGAPPSRCVRYNVHKLAVTLVIYFMILQLLNVCCLLLAAFIYRKFGSASKKVTPKQTEMTNIQETDRL